MKKILFLLVCFVGFIFIGCATEFSPNNKYVEFNNGKAYMIPYGVVYFHGDNKDICGKSDKILWIEKQISSKIFKLAAISNAEAEQLFKQAFAQGLIGCSDPMSDQELQYVMYRQNLRQQQKNDNWNYAIDSWTKAFNDSADSYNNMARQTQKMTDDLYNYNQQQRQNRQDNLNYYQMQQMNNNLYDINRNLNNLNNRLYP